jgi:hypothetical protein
MGSANLLVHQPFDEPPPWNILLIEDIYGDNNAQGLQCETSPCILYIQNSGPFALGVPFRDGFAINYGMEWGGVFINHLEGGGGGFPSGYNWSLVEDDPIRVRILGLHFNPRLNLPPVFDSGWQTCETISQVTNKPTCEPIDLDGNPILVTLTRNWAADETHCPPYDPTLEIDEQPTAPDGTCRLTFRIEFAVNSSRIATAELWVHSAWFNSR